MRITTILLIVLVVAYFVQGFNAPKCEHVFTPVEQPIIEIEQPELRLGGQVYREYSWPTGRQEGKELICVKCFHVQKQILDYGQAVNERKFDWQHGCKVVTDPDSCMPFSAGSFICDTARSLTLGSSGSLFLKVDTLKWSKVEPVK